MSHFNRVSIKLTQADAEGIKEMLKGIAQEQGLTFFENASKKNWYGISQTFLCGVEGVNLAPMGFAMDKGELRLVADLESGHSKSSTKGEATRVHQVLTEEVALYRHRKSRRQTNAAKARLAETGVNVNVKVK